MNSKQAMNHAADNIRILAASMVEKAKSGHPGGAMGGADFINVLYSEFLQYDPQNPKWVGRDRFFLDPGHMAPMLYAQLALIGKFSIDELKQLRQWGSPTPGHPEVDVMRGIENSSGPLGQGHVYAVGAAMAAKFLAARTGNPTFDKETIYTYISDGGIQEEISQGAGRVAGHLGLNNLIMFFDSNDIQLSTETKDVISEDTAMKYRAWGWKVIEIDGNDCDQIREALTAAKAEDKRPTLIIGKCIMGKGARKGDNTSYEHSCKTHGAPLGAEAYKNTMINLGADQNDPFTIFDDVKEIYAKRAEELKDIVAARYAEEKAWAEANPEKAAMQDEWFSGAAPKIDWSSIQQKANEPTRNASATVLGVLAEQVPNMVCASADLSNSDKTDGFLKKTHAFTNGDFSGAFFQAGVAELTMACCCIGMALHGGVITACGTFFVFSDYMKPAIRMAALMELPVKFIWSHDAFRVGEDGPTHEPVEQEAQIRLMEKLKNHHGKNSMLVLRPADVEETTVCWKMAMENTDTPTALILSRQNVNMLPEGTDYSQAEKGGYIVAGSQENPDVILVANGSEVSTLVAGAELLKKDGIKTRVVSIPSEGLFRNQSREYQDSVVPAGIKKFGLTAGLPINLLGLVGTHGKIWGLESFGFSAPYKVLDEKLGFTAENVYNQVKSMFE
ncbi:transketolase [Phocaeicola barnesiae]|jgi:transketolase|uniref:transketolase family protein n=1 Tax=Phocaeicola barnesiae TaxID=376804 RepID=UPI001F283C6C|nr:transketolase [Phocaeicola barnesiae]MCF2577159.1 transketolase [Phocaeicola barnesiae]MDM8233251.1 transketolase [Phocaeicola barnesiae]MDM8240606.1 transketolase [Phocaeicola barnesiae]MDM8255398.1 transketolase [Phocaeicola barnesiae]MDM8255920.1 transketolase [Phocaeicola barnesiae]